MSEQNESVAQAYAIAEHFSERARREAAAQHYSPTYLGGKIGLSYAATNTMPRCKYKGQKCCPMGVMRYVDQHDPLYFDPAPIPKQIGMDIVRRTDVSGEARLALANDLAEKANRFTRDWDSGKLQPKDLAAALGLVPPSEDEQTHGD